MLIEARVDVPTTLSYRVFRAELVVDGRPYGTPRLFSERDAACVYLAQMLRVLADELRQGQVRARAMEPS